MTWTWEQDFVSDCGRMLTTNVSLDKALSFSFYGIADLYENHGNQQGLHYTKVITAGFYPPLYL